MLQKTAINTAVTFSIASVLMLSTQLNAANVVTTDQIVQGSECVGGDCSTSESFGSDTIRLKENNLRIHFDDTSGSASFPKNDWRIVINDSTNGGAEYFAIEDATAGKTPFKIEAGAPNNALYVDDAGNIGIGTSAPIMEAHITDGDSPTLRLEQDESSGWGAQTWDIAGNETNFFIRDVTNSSKLPFKILPGADHNVIVIDGNSEVGMGTDKPDSKLHVVGKVLAGPTDAGAPTSPATIHAYGNDGNTKVAVEDTLSTTADRTLLELTNQGGSRIDLLNTSGSTNASNWRIATEDTSGSFIITKIGSGQVEFEIDTAGNIITSGTTVHTSDRNKKYNIVNIDEKDILNKISKLPVKMWSYKSEDPSVRHMGPMAQDFRKSFGLGLDDKTIAGVDVVGVALASIKALKLELDERDSQVALLTEKLQHLESIVLEKNTRF